MKADLHVHTWASSQSGTLAFLRSRDCYSAPEDVYRVARARGMTLVTFTDHDSIDGCREFSHRHPDAADFVWGEEVSCRFPQRGLRDLEVHLAVYGITEALHRELQPLRGNVFELIARLRAADVFFALNHLLHFYRTEIPLAPYLQLLRELPALEVRNGAMLAEHNELVAAYARSVSPGWGTVAGSDAHTLRRVGTTWTEVPGATTREEFLAGLRDGRGVPGGRHGSALAISGDTYGVVARFMASLLGAGRCDHALEVRAACLAFCAASLPFQFLPLLIALATKRRERRHVRAVIAALGQESTVRSALPTTAVEKSAS